ncbi:hypothetical protein ACFV23_06395, partial [Streptomyces sp. NPDC059627]
ITTIRGRLNSFFASASFSSGVSGCGYDTGSSRWCGPRGACGDENEGAQDRFDLPPRRPPVGMTPRLSDAELVTLATMKAVLGYTSGLPALSFRA